MIVGMWNQIPWSLTACRASQDNPGRPSGQAAPWRARCVSLERLEQLSLSLKEIAEKELNNTPLTDEEYELIRSYGVQLEHFWLEALRDEGIEHHSQAYDQPAAIVTDVATDVGGQVLQDSNRFYSRNLRRCACGR